MTGLDCPCEAWPKTTWREISLTTTSKIEFPSTKGQLLASSKTVFHKKKLPSRNGIPQTRLAFVARVDLSGNIPAAAMNFLSVNFLSFLSDLRVDLDQSRQIDRARRLEIIAKIRQEKSFSDSNFND